VSFELVVVAVVTVVFTSQGYGPFAASAHGGSATTSGALTQAFLISAVLVLLPLAIVAAQHTAALVELSAREVMFRQGFNQSLLGMMLLRRSGGSHRVVEFNDRSPAMLGMTTEQLVDAEWLDVIGDGIVGEPPELGKPWHGEVKLAIGDMTRWLDVAVSPMRSAADTEMLTVQLVDVTHRHIAEEILSLRASSDSLTGLFNRAHFLECLTERLDASADSTQLLALLFVDLDDFKDINDSAGHAIGDDVLIEVARRMSTMTRPGDLLARFGGDEFVLICDALASAEQAEAIAARLIEAVGDSVDIDGISYPVGLSIGIALSAANISIGDMMSNADTAMYASKAAGKSRTTLFSEVHRAHARRTVKLRPQLRRALESKEFVLYVQPIVDMVNGNYIGGEALVRWQHPTEGLLMPDKWLDVAESTGLMPALGEWVLNTACHIAAEFPDGLGATTQPRIHVNVSARQLDDGHFGEVVARALRNAHLAPDRLAIEFTETHLARIPPELLGELRVLSATGVLLAADDFGTGYSPLTKITELPLDMVKIDKQFVAKMLDDRRSMAIVHALVGLGTALSLDVIAEGVETVAQAEALIAAGCRLGQGFLWSHAVPPAHFLRKLVKHSPRRAAILSS
jgi:diguanylate cyclase (GGDEF)-like protein